MRRALLLPAWLLVWWLTPAGCFFAPQRPCDTDGDCRPTESCVEGFCISTPGGGGDAGHVDDAGEPQPRPDGGEDPVDSGPPDAGQVPDGGTGDGGTPDAGVDDAGKPDAGAADAGDADAGLNDGGGPNMPPQALAASAECSAFIPCVITLVAVDEDGPGPTVISVENEVGGTLLQTGAQVVFTPNIEAGPASFDFRAHDGIDGSLPATVSIKVVNARSCASLLNTGGPTTDGVFQLDPDGPDPEPPFMAHCRMVAGGYTLAMKIDGTQSTFAYDAVHWNQALPYQPDLPDLDVGEAKLPSFAANPFEEIEVGFDVDDGQGFRWVHIAHQAPSLLDLFNGPEDVEVAVPQGDAAWLDAVPGAVVQNNCSEEGFNLGAGHNAVRIGLVADNNVPSAGDCPSPDSRIGVGGGGKGGPCTGCGSLGTHLPTAGGQNAGEAHYPAFAAVYVRSTIFTHLPNQPSCAEHGAAGATLAGTYIVDGSLAMCDAADLGSADAPP